MAVSCRPGALSLSPAGQRSVPSESACHCGNHPNDNPQPAGWVWSSVTEALLLCLLVLSVLMRPWAAAARADRESPWWNYQEPQEPVVQPNCHERSNYTDLDPNCIKTKVINTRTRGSVIILLLSPLRGVCSVAFV